MITVFCGLHALPGATPADVRDALATVAPPMTPGIRHEVRSVPCPRGTDAAAWAFGAAPYDAGVIALEVDNYADWRLAADAIHDEIRGVLGTVAAADRTVYLATRPDVVICDPVDYGAQPVKALFFARRKPGISVEEFNRRWAETHPHIIPLIPGLRRYTQHHTVPQEYTNGRQPPWDGVAEMWWNAPGDMVKALESAPFSNQLPADAAEFVDVASMAGFTATEIWVK